MRDIEVIMEEWGIQQNKLEYSDVKKSIEQILTSFIPYFILLTIIYFLLRNGYPYWVALLFTPIASLFLIKIFIILHDCSHKSYLGKSIIGCFILGHICGILTFTSFFSFRRSHVIHHATVSNLEKRGVGDIWTLTVDEYLSLPQLKKIVYRIFRNPIFLFGIVPPILFIVLNRIPEKTDRLKEILSIIFTNAMIVVILAIAYFTIGFKMYVAIQLPVICLASSFGVWLFYIHHQFKNVYWSHNKDWNRFDAATKGSSFYKFPGFIEWFTGHIGYHYIHHLNYRIPNYKLEKYYRETPQLHMKPFAFRDGFESMFLALWDEKTGKLVSFSTLKNA
ncbi:MAG: fatty acid desaturase [Candidatus Auribacter fodinae]|jgi:omega-6 fatty acid desaturase (delta-12 desaturase)|uniref:Fatty acid desaturase n=1 Tax=Candidatus Auribacter fodinae TaxID=2093366 RepID=A0A3A4R9H4_9BACT|nr:MAG: fatty acid desaturase [Candidatus Auribacter fodinae]